MRGLSGNLKYSQTVKEIPRLENEDGGTLMLELTWPSGQIAYPHAARSSSTMLAHFTHSWISPAFLWLVNYMKNL